MRSGAVRRTWADAAAEMFAELTPKQRLIAIICATICIVLWLCLSR